MSADLVKVPCCDALDKGNTAKVKAYIDDMEAEHLVLKAMLAQLASEPPSNPSLAFDVAAELVMYLERHFVAEEEFMEWIGFPHRVSHARNHAQALSLLKDAVRQASRHNELLVFVDTFLNRWLEDHVAYEDSRILEYASRRRPA